MRVVTMALIDIFYILLSGIGILFAFLTSSHLVFAFAQSVIIFVLLYLAVVRIPLILNWSDNLYGSAFLRVFSIHIFAILTYAICYYRSGSLETFADAVYFSATTWTTLGYGDISPTGGIRLLTSVQALTGLISFSVFASVVWLYCERRLRAPGDNEQSEERYEVSLDGPFGLFRPLENEKSAEDQAARDKLHLENCYRCGSSARIEKYYDIIGRTTPLPKFVTCCTKCGELVKPRANAYLAAWTWNRAAKKAVGKR